MKPRKSHMGITWKMYVILVIFVGIVVGVIWFFQAQMLNFFYQTTKFQELEMSATELTTRLYSKPQLEDAADAYASEYDMDIWVYRMLGGEESELLAMAKGTGEPEIPFMSNKFAVFFDRAVQNGGVYIAMVLADDLHENTELQILDDNFGDSTGYPFLQHNHGKISAVYVQVREIHGERFMIVESANLTPARTMVTTLQDQAFWIALALSSVALIMAVILSRLITKPIVQMNEAAKCLAQGRYDTEFSGHGYREINELADTLNYASGELAKNDRLQKELISNISHDLRTPLTMIKGYSEVMRDIPGENTPENIQIIIDETSRLSDLVNDMLDISRIQAGTRKPEFVRFSLTGTVRDTLHRYDRLIMQNGYQVEFFSDGDVNVVADRGMILQVVYNLINNAINYTGEDKRVFVRQDVVGDSVRISVVDTGEGISEDQLALIWDRYYKVDKVHKRATVGTGLGLSIVKGILELHHAVYGVQSTIGKGSVFWFELKMAGNETIHKDYIEANYEDRKTKEAE